MKKKRELSERVKQVCIGVLLGGRPSDASVIYDIPYQTVRLNLHKFCREANPELYEKLHTQAVYEGSAFPLTSTLKLHRFGFIERPPMRSIEEVERELAESEREIVRLQKNYYRADLHLAEVTRGLQLAKARRLKNT